jgi:signal transduction histidine kinase
MYIASAEKKQQPGSDLLRQSADFILHAIEEIRRLSKGLVTPLIKDFGLVKAIESVLEDLSAVNDMKIDFVSDTFFEDDIHYDFKLSIFRIVQEQVNNVLKHSGATELKIDLGRNNNSIYLSIYDNGVGFDLAVQKKGIGLYNITSRVELFNGTISIHTAPTSGCAMHMSFPITQDIMRH